ncbi:hypothetical protein GCM10023225_05270 [Kineococcus glutinatus]|uniref:SIS domain-containing protein n=1 Tax=Kineococcus glutinatus TaxID=1070872 RepID=A0ABP9HA03_9ACTN
MALARKAHAAGVHIVLITMDAGSSIAKLAEVTVVLPGASPKLRSVSAVTSIQPMGSAFEQMCLLTCDAMILSLMQQMGESSESMFPRHADLE